ncbi:hypothetical protein EV360DRAFT_81661 [Lentinula raphanica]|nr:hypothetical protein EV360DRAFT_81661 [Lentinula raphanica]
MDNDGHHAGPALITEAKHAKLRMRLTPLLRSAQHVKSFATAKVEQFKIRILSRSIESSRAELGVSFQHSQPPSDVLVHDHASPGSDASMGGYVTRDGPDRRSVGIQAKAGNAGNESDDDWKPNTECDSRYEYEHSGCMDSGSSSCSDEPLGFNAGIVFSSINITMSGYPRNPVRFAKTLPVKIMVLYIKGSVLVLVAALGQKKPGIVLPGSGDFNETFLEWEFRRHGRDLRIDLTKTENHIRTHLRFSFPNKAEYLTFKQAVTPSIQNVRILHDMDQSSSNWDWILDLFSVL